MVAESHRSGRERGGWCQAVSGVSRTKSIAIVTKRTFGVHAASHDGSDQTIIATDGGNSIVQDRVRGEGGGPRAVTTIRPRPTSTTRDTKKASTPAWPGGWRAERAPSRTRRSRQHAHLGRANDCLGSVRSRPRIAGRRARGRSVASSRPPSRDVPQPVAREGHRANSGNSRASCAWARRAVVR
jgi:hypothetical protein